MCEMFLLETAPWSRKITVCQAALGSDVQSRRNTKTMFWLIGRRARTEINGGHLVLATRLSGFAMGQQRLRKRKQGKHCSTVSPFVERVKPYTGTALLCDRHAAQHLTVWTTYNPTHRDSHRTISVSVGLKTKKSLVDTTHKGGSTCLLIEFVSAHLIKDLTLKEGFSFSSPAKKLLYSQLWILLKFCCFFASWKQSKGRFWRD